MLIDKFTKHTIFSLPLIFGDILTRDILKENEFVNMYEYDMNHPLLSNHVFLVFHNIKKELLDKLKSHSSYNSDYLMIKDKIKYTVISFNKGFSIYVVISSINKGLYYSLPYEEKIKILSFWNKGNIHLSNIHAYLFNNHIKTEKPLCENITLEDSKKGVA